jgi:hypothetical protein
MVVDWLVGIACLVGACAAYTWCHDKLNGTDLVRDTWDQIRLAMRSIEAWDQTWRSNPLRSGIIVCLTTLPSRLPYIEPTLKSLLYQTRSPLRIRLHIPDYSIREGCRYVIPPYLTHLSGIEIVICKDHGPATKFIPAVQDLPAGQPILVVDDDRIYPPTLVDNFQHWSEQNPETAIGAAGWIVPHDLTDRELNFWRNFRQTPPAPLKSTRIHRRRRVHILEGYAGYLIKPEFFDPTHLTDYNAAPASAFYVDDVWMSAHCRVPRVVFPADRHVFKHWRDRPFEDTALWRVNNGGGDPEKRNNTIMIRHFAGQWEALNE